MLLDESTSEICHNHCIKEIGKFRPFGTNVNNLKKDEFKNKARKLNGETYKSNAEKKTDDTDSKMKISTVLVENFEEKDDIIVKQKDYIDKHKRQDRQLVQSGNGFLGETFCTSE